MRELCELVPDPAWARLGAWGGGALALALLARGPTAGARGPALVVAVGDAVRRGLPTAARAVVAGRAAANGPIAEGQIGGGLGPRLAGVADALVLGGRAGEVRAGGVLVVGRDAASGAPTVELVRLPELVGLAPAAKEERLALCFGPCAALVVGPGGEAGLPFACLASGLPRPSFVGRGGLGALLARAGLVAVVVTADPPPSEPGARGVALLEALVRSPRLEARASAGTFELFHALAARGELRGRAGEPLPPELGRALVDEARERARDRHGCRGCPTPCGWSFERPGGERQPARFGATHALLAPLGLAGVGDALALLAACDRVGVDAKEVGPLLALAATAGERGLLSDAPRGGDAAALARWVERLADPVDPGAAPLRAGAAALAEQLGLAPELVRLRAAAEPAGTPLARLARAAPAGGTDPLRSFPFLAELDGERLADLLARALPPGARSALPLAAAGLDPTGADGVGRWVWLHENLASGLDLSGFCAFSGAGLLADGTLDLDRLAERVLPAAILEDPAWSALSPGARCHAAGASLALARHAAAPRRRAPGAPGAGGGSAGGKAGEALLEAPGMLPEYRAWRGLDAAGVPLPAALAALGTPALGRPVRVPARARARPARASGSGASVPASRARVADAPPAPGTVRLGASGPLGDALRAAEGAPAEVVLELVLPAAARDVLAALAAARPALAPRLFEGERILPAVWRAGERVGADALVRDGDALDLVQAIAGG